MVVKRTGLVAVAAIAVGLASVGTAEAGARLHLNFFPFASSYGDYYDEPMFVPAPRYYYYYEPRPRQRRYYSYQYEPEYYEPEASPEYIQPRKKKRTSLPAKKSATKQEQAMKSAGVSCSKATEIVSGYGFTEVKATSCKGKVYAFNGRRDGKPFSIKVSSASGELTEVKKQ